jgi:GTP pyrophosphokinase
MEAQGVGLDQIHDVIAFRIILDAPPESVYTALGIVHATWRPVPGRFKDYVALAKPNGYQSLHTTVIGPAGERMEIQIRTREMHKNAELGIAAHWRYKEGKSGARGDDDEQKFDWLRQLLDRQQELSDPHEFLDAVKVDLFPDEVFVFTPRGDVINLPRGSTPLDFAYAIHSEVGSHCAGARVNGRIVPLRHALVDGDTVEILTSEAQFPRKDWLDFVVSGKAREIRHAVRRPSGRAAGAQPHPREGLRRSGLSLARLLEAARSRLAQESRARPTISSPRSATASSRPARSSRSCAARRRPSRCRRRAAAGCSAARVPSRRRAGSTSTACPTCSCASRTAATRCRATR